MNRYLLKYAVSLFALLIVVGTINLSVDPDGRFRFIDKAGFNQIKISPNPGARQGKAVALQQCDYGTIILGSSRAETGIFPESTQFIARPVYNASLIGTSMLEVYRMGEYLLNHQAPETIVLGLDFLMFSKARTYADDYLDSMLNPQQSLLSTLKYALSMDALMSIWITVDWNTSGVAKRCFYSGHNDKRRTIVDQRFAFDETEFTYMRNPGLYGKHELSTEYLDKLEALIRLIIEKDIELKLFISPMHAVHMELLDDAGLIPSLHEWKQRMVEIVTRINGEYPARPPLELWDFSGYNSVTTEPVPAEGSPEQMQWYRDSAHYRVAAGDMVIERLLHPESAAANLPADFGINLRSENISAVLEKERDLAKQYRAAQPAEVENARRLAAEAREFAQD